MNFDFYDSPELLDIQRKAFYTFLKQGIPELLSKQFPIKAKSGNYSIELLLNDKHIKLITPDSSPRDCILKMKTYSCKLYARVKLVCKNASGETRSISLKADASSIVYQSNPEWVLLGQLPMMTKRGHFIINGSPRVIVHQVVRSPGIYFQKLINKDERKMARFYADIIPLKGVWVRLQMTKKGRIEAKFKKGKKVQVECLQKCLQVIEGLPNVKENTNSSLQSLYKKARPIQNQLVLKSENRESPMLYEDYSTLFDTRKSRGNTKSEHDAFITLYDKLYRTTQDKELEDWQKKKSNLSFFKGLNPENAFKRKKCSENLFASFKLSSRYDLGLLGREKINEKFNIFKTFPVQNSVTFFKSSSTFSLFTREARDLDKNCTNARGYKSFCISMQIENDVHAHTHAPLAPMQIKDLLRHTPFGARRRGTASTSARATQSVCLKQKSKLKNLQGLGLSETNPNTLTEGHSFVCTYPPGKYLRNVQRSSPGFSKKVLWPSARLSKDNGSDKNKYKKDNLNTQLTSIDLSSASVWLYQLRKGEKNTDDIDHSQNRRVRTAGELLQTQFENGVERLKNLLSTKLQEWRGSSSRSIFSSIFKSRYKIRYSEKSLLKTSRQSGFSYNDFSFGFGYVDVALQNKKDLLYKSVDKTKSSYKCKYKSKQAPLDFVPLVPRICKKLCKKICTCSPCPLGGMACKSSYKSTICTCLPTHKSFTRKLGSKQRQSVNALVESTNQVDTSFKQLTNLADLTEKSYKISVKELFSTKPISGALREFFGSNPLSQYMDQTNPLAEITHKRRISSLGIGGVSRESAGMAIRGIHPTHYGRICPIETPEGKNAGLVNSLAFYTKLDTNGFLKTPYYRVIDGQIQSVLGFSFTSAKAESLTGLYIAPSDLQKSSNNILRSKNALLDMQIADLQVPVRVTDNQLDVFKKENATKVQLMGISPIQMISVATSLIPFLEHNDANRALMGSNMQRQAVPLMIAERPIVGTGLESIVIVESGHITESSVAGFADQITATKVDITRLAFIKKNKISHVLKYLDNPKICKAKLCTCNPLPMHFGQGQKHGQEVTSTKLNERTVTPKGYKRVLALALQSEALRLPCPPKGGMAKGRAKLRFAYLLTNLLATTSTKLLANRRFAVVRSFALVLAVVSRFVRPVNLQAMLLTESILFSAKAKKRQGCSGKSKQKLVLVSDYRRLVLRERNIKSKAKTSLGKKAGLRLDNQFKIKESVPKQNKISKYIPSIPSRFSSSIKQDSVLFSLTKPFTTFSRSNQNTCITEKPLIRQFDWVQKGDILSDCSASNKGELSVGKNVLVAYIPWEGYNFEDAIVISERLVREHVYTSLHIERYTFQAQDLNDGHEWFTKNLPGIEDRLVEHLEESGLPKVGSFVQEGDILVGKVRYLNKKPSSPYERLLCDILGEKNFAARNKSLYVPKGVEARVIYHKVINQFDNEPLTSNISLKQLKDKRFSGIEAGGPFLTLANGEVGSSSYNCKSRLQIFNLNRSTHTNQNKHSFALYQKYQGINNFQSSQQRNPAKTVNIFLGEKRVIQVGDKISGRHGNKGVISTILPRQDMPYLPDGTPIDLILNPLGVPSRMNVGQVLECLLGLASDYLKQNFKITAFDERYGVEASKSLVFLKLYQARLQSGQNWLFQVNFPGKTRLVDGRSGECFDQWITVGKAYILKLIHMVSEKIHARSTGPYALITQQPLRGRSNKGGQRLGEMEVWALEGFGAAYTLQELLTKKSDDYFGRNQIVDSILPKPPSIVDTLSPNYRVHQNRAILGHPEIFKVLLCELQALCLDLGVYVVTPESYQRGFLGVVH